MDELPTAQEVAEARAQAQTIADAAGVDVAAIHAMLDHTDSLIKQAHFAPLEAQDQSPSKDTVIAPQRETLGERVDKFGLAAERQALDAFLLGHYPQVMARMRRAAAPLTGEKSSYVDMRDELRNVVNKDPKSAKLAGKVLGYGAQMAALPLASVLPEAALATPAARLATSGGVGGVMAAASNPGDTPGVVDPFQFEARAKNVPMGVATGLAAGAATEGFLGADRQWIAPLREVMDLRAKPASYNTKMRELLKAQANALEKTRSGKFDELRQLYGDRTVRMSPEELAGMSPEARALLLERLGLPTDAASFDQSQAEMAGKGMPPATWPTGRKRALVSSGMQDQPGMPMTYDEKMALLASREVPPGAPASWVPPGEPSATPAEPGRFPPNANTMPAPMTGARGQPVIPKNVTLPAEADIPLQTVHDLKIAEDQLAKRPAGTVFSEGEAARSKVHGDVSNNARAILENAEPQSEARNATMQRLIRLRAFMKKQARSESPGALAETQKTSRQGLMEEAANLGGNRDLLDMARRVRMARQLEWPNMLRDMQRHPIETTIGAPVRVGAWGLLKASKLAAPVQANPALSPEIARALELGIIDMQDLEDSLKKAGAK